MEKTKKVLVGFFVAAALLLFGAGLFLIGNSNQLFTKSFDVYAEFAKITGVQEGGKVRVAGMDAGTITRIEVPAGPTSKFRVHFRIVEKLHPVVRQNSVVSIQTDGLLGNKFLQVDSGTEDSQLAAENSMIQSKEPFDWGDLMDEINGAVKQANGIMAGVKDQLVSTLDQVEGTVKSANVLITGASPSVRNVLASADRIGANLNQIIDGVRAGEGTVGALFQDKELYTTVKRGVDNGEKAMTNIRETTESVSKIVHKVDESEIVPEVEKTVKQLQAITVQIKDAVEKFQSASGEGGVAENLQRTLAGASEAMSDLSDNTEALKHNFFFRGFFKRRGFFDLGALTPPQYLEKDFGKGFSKYNAWFEGRELFAAEGKGLDTLSEEGKKALDEAMTEVLRYPRNGPLIIEGYSTEGDSAARFLSGRRRAARVRTYILDKFHLRPAYVGIVSLSDGQKNGIDVVSFYKKK